MQYDEKLANNVPLKRFQEALHAEGLIELHTTIYIWNLHQK